jgi:phosphoribosylglycinamide formyltransferase-1
MPTDTEETLAERVLEVEHRIYPQALRLVAEGKVTFAATGGAENARSSSK